MLDLDAFEANLARMATAAKTTGINLRPHAKAHKCVEIAKRQVAAGACGLCVATVSEAELMAKAGIAELLLTSPLADPLKIARVVETGAMVVVDHLRQVEWYQQAARAANAQIAVLIDLDVGDHRTGAASLEQAIDIALAIDQASHLWLRGAQAYSVAGYTKDCDEKRLSAHAFELAAETRDAMASHGLHTDIVSGGHRHVGYRSVDCARDRNPGRLYALMDLAYRNIGVDFQNAYCTHYRRQRESPELLGHRGCRLQSFLHGSPLRSPTDRARRPATYRWGGDEFGYVDIKDCATRPRLGSRIEFIPPHCDPTVNLHDRIYVCRGDQVEDVWPVMNRVK